MAIAADQSLSRGERATGGGGDLDYDVVVIGSGFGGSVTALRLVEKGYRVAVLEAGRRFADDDFPKTNWHVRDFLWAPQAGCYGLQRIHKVDDVMILAGAGVGGGSLIYANTLYRPSESFYEDPHWAAITDWFAELDAHYDQATRMLGVVTNPTTTPADEAFLAVARDMGVQDTFRPTPVGVYFNDEPGRTDPDPFFGGAGPARSGCLECGACMTGCRHNAKNTLVKNYLGLAESAGAEILPMTTVTGLRRGEDGTWLVDTRDTASFVKRAAGGAKRRIAARRSSRPEPEGATRTFRSRDVVFSAGTYGTQKLLHQFRLDGTLPELSPRLGYLTRTNSEALLGVAADEAPDPDFTHGVAITSSFFPDANTHVEPVRYGKGSNLMYLLGTVLSDGVEGVPRYRQWAKAVAARPGDAARALWVRGGSERMIITLVMQDLNNSVTLFGERALGGRIRLRSKQGEGDPNPTYIPVANEVVRRAAKILGGRAFGNLGEVIDAPFTAHFIGGVTIGATAAEGVIDPYHRIHAYPGLHVADGSTLTANPGVNPSLTITAMTERAMAYWPNKGEADPRPALGEPYARLDPVAPRSPVVPAGAPGELRQRVMLGMPSLRRGAGSIAGSVEATTVTLSPAGAPAVIEESAALGSAPAHGEFVGS